MAQRQVTLLPEAELDLIDIERRIRVNNGELVAERKLNEIARRIDLVAFAPGVGRQRTDIDGATLYFTVVDVWYIIYEDVGDKNLILVHRVIRTDYYNQFLAP
jgi:plasmid stabilization system protein ParE